MLDANNKNWYQLRRNIQYSQGICPAFATGKCIFQSCQAARLLRKETLQAWAKWLCKEIEPGCIRIKNGEDIQPCRMFRGSLGNKWDDSQYGSGPRLPEPSIVRGIQMGKQQIENNRVTSLLQLDK